MRIKYQEADNLLAKLRFTPTGKRHHKMFVLIYKGQTVLKTRFSHGQGDMAATDKFRGQLKMNENEFRVALDCTLDFDSYIALLRRKAIVTGQTG